MGGGLILTKELIQLIMESPYYIATLIDRGADITKQKNNNGKTPLFNAHGSHTETWEWINVEMERVAKE